MEGRGFRDHQEYFDANNIVVVGVSFDSVGENDAFARKYAFRFALLSDTDRSMATAYGACEDPKALWAERVSILIDERGTIERVYQQVDPRDHAARVLADLMGV